MEGGMDEALTQAQWLRVTHDLPRSQGLKDERVKNKTKQTGRCSLPVVDFGNHLSVFLLNQVTELCSPATPYQLLRVGR